MWSVTYIKMTDGNKIPADKLAFIPRMKGYGNQLIATQ